VSDPSIEVETGTLAFGPTLSRSIEARSKAIDPFVTTEEIWTFLQENTATSLTSQPGLGETGLRGNFEAGAAIATPNGATLSG